MSTILFAAIIAVEFFIISFSNDQYFDKNLLSYRELLKTFPCDSHVFFKYRSSLVQVDHTVIIKSSDLKLFFKSDSNIL